MHDKQVADPLVKFLTTGEVAKLLNVSKSWLEYHRCKGDGIPFVRYPKSRTVRYLYSDVVAWQASLKKLNTPKDGGGNARY